MKFYKIRFTESDIYGQPILSGRLILTIMNFINYHQMKKEEINKKVLTPTDNQEEEVNWPVVIGIIATMIIIVLVLNFA